MKLRSVKAGAGVLRPLFHSDIMQKYISAYISGEKLYAVPQAYFLKIFLWSKFSVNQLSNEHIKYDIVTRWITFLFIVHATCFK